MKKLYYSFIFFYFSGSLLHTLAPRIRADPLGSSTFQQATFNNKKGAIISLPNLGLL